MLRAELQTKLKKRFTRVVLKRGKVRLGLWGEAGSGKTWLAERLLDDLPCRYGTFPVRMRPADLAQKLPRP